MCKCMCVHLYVCVCVRLYVCVCVCICVRHGALQRSLALLQHGLARFASRYVMFVCMCMCVCVCECGCMCVCVCVCVKSLEKQCILIGIFYIFTKIS